MKNIYLFQSPTSRITAYATAAVFAAELEHFTSDKFPDDGCRLATIENVERPIVDIYRLSTFRVFNQPAPTYSWFASSLP